MAAAILWTPLVTADWSLVNITEGVTETSREIYQLHMIIFYVCVIIGVIVYGVILWSILSYRHASGAVAADFDDHKTLEIIWTIIPSIILIAMAWPSIVVLNDMYDQSEGAVNIKITGYQWKWRYEYQGSDPAETFDFFSTLATPSDEIYNLDEKGEHYLLEVDEPLVIPVGERVRFLITANDVIHAWWVPDFAVKQDAIPGMINTAWTVVQEPGIYRGQCAELCGKDHGFMPIVVRAVTTEEFAEWRTDKLAEAHERSQMASKQWGEQELYELGKQMYNTNCAACHRTDGIGAPPVFPALKGSEMVLIDLDRHIDQVINGATGTAMAAFGEQLNDAELAAVITYERLAWGNREAGNGQIVTPAMIQAFKNKSRRGSGEQ